MDCEGKSCNVTPDGDVMCCILWLPAAFYRIFLGSLDAQHTLKSILVISSLKRDIVNKNSPGKKRYLKRFEKGLLHRQSAIFSEKLKLETTNRHDGRCDGFMPHTNRNFRKKHILTFSRNPPGPHHIRLWIPTEVSAHWWSFYYRSNVRVCPSTGPDTVLRLARLALRKQSYLQVLQVILLYIL